MATAPPQDIVTLMTGFPGFLASHLIPKLFEQSPQTMLYLLIQPQMASIAEARCEELTAHHPAIRDRLRLIEGDITREQLGLTPQDYEQLRDQLEVTWHLAAIYDLAVSKTLAYRVNVTGTINVLDLCEQAPKFRRLNYISTCYVSGQRTGTILEAELDKQQQFKNHYEETKFWAEIELKRRQETIPSTIFRPGIVIGDSRTGQTDKYDGPYYLFKLLIRMPEHMPLPQIGHSDAVVNLVPIDFVVDAISHLGADEHTIGQTYQIADPEPMRARDIMALSMRLLGRKSPKGSLPASLVDSLLTLKRVERAVGIPREALQYFNHDARYDSSNTQRALKAARQIRCPHLSTYLEQILRYVVEHPETPSA